MLCEYRAKEFRVCAKVKSFMGMACVSVEMEKGRRLDSALLNMSILK